MTHIETHLGLATNYRQFYDQDFKHQTIIIYAAIKLAINDKAEKIIVQDRKITWFRDDAKLGEYALHETPIISSYISETEKIFEKDKIIKKYLYIVSRSEFEIEIKVTYPNHQNIRLILVDMNQNMINAWQKAFSGIEQVSIQHGSILDIECHAIVSPANSFGFMDGGLDLQISQFFGWHVQQELQQLIKYKHHGELLVGVAELIHTHHSRIPYLISAPTMRVPMILGSATVNVYLAMRAVLLLITHGVTNDYTPVQSIIQTIAIPGLGTGVGKVPVDICAQQMKAAVDEVLLNQPTFPQTWREAQLQHIKLYSENTHDLQHYE